MANSCCSHEHHKPQKWYQHKTVMVSAIFVALIAVSYVVPMMDVFRHHLFMYAREIWWAIGLGLLIGGVIDHYVPREYISHILATKNKRTILWAVVTGFFMSACSHGILGIAMQLHKKGASGPAVIAFLLASPWANLPFTLMMIGFFGVPQTAFIVGSALVIAIITGFIFQVLDHSGWIEHNTNTVDVADDFNVWQDIQERMKGFHFSVDQIKHDSIGVLKGAASLGDMILWWLLIGIIAGAAIGAYVPQDVFQNYFGPNFWGMLATLGAATVIEVCSEGSIPIAFEVFRNTGALGNALVFLMAGVATDYTEIGLVWANVGRRTAMWLPVVTVPQVIFFGWLANQIF